VNAVRLKGVHLGQLPVGGLPGLRVQPRRALLTYPQHTAQAVADRHQITNVYEDYAKLIANPAVQVLDIAVPPNVQIDTGCPGKKTWAS
jgi:hypothetical protein